MLSLLISPFIINLSPMKTTTKRTAFVVISPSFLYDSPKHKITASRFTKKVFMNSTYNAILQVCRMKRERKRLEIYPQAAHIITTLVSRRTWSTSAAHL